MCVCLRSRGTPHTLQSALISPGGLWVLLEVLCVCVWNTNLQLDLLRARFPLAYVLTPKGGRFFAAVFIFHTAVKFMIPLSS